MVVVRWPGKTRGAMGFACRFACPDERSGTRGFFFLGTCPAALRQAKKRTKKFAEGIRKRLCHSTTRLNKIF
jgi:hypothetical protein